MILINLKIYIKNIIMKLLYFLYNIIISISSISSISNLEINIYTNIPYNNYIFNLLDDTALIYKKSNLNIDFFVKNIQNIELQSSYNDINVLIKSFYNSEDVTMILINTPNYTSIKGVSYVNSMCGEYAVMIINIYDTIYKTIPYVIAHELGHVYGANHNDYQRNIMNSVINNNEEYYFIDENIQEMNFNSECLFNIPENYIYISKNITSSAKKYNFSNLYLLTFILSIYFNSINFMEQYFYRVF